MEGAHGYIFKCNSWSFLLRKWCLCCFICCNSLCRMRESFFIKREYFLCFLCLSELHCLNFLLHLLHIFFLLIHCLGSWVLHVYRIYMWNSNSQDKSGFENAAFNHYKISPTCAYTKGVAVSAAPGSLSSFRKPDCKLRNMLCHWSVTANCIQICSFFPCFFPVFFYFLCKFSSPALG